MLLRFRERLFVMPGTDALACAPVEALGAEGSADEKSRNYPGHTLSSTHLGVHSDHRAHCRNHHWLLRVGTKAAALRDEVVKELSQEPDLMA
jgi:hypothetical protein